MKGPGGGDWYGAEYGGGRWAGAGGYSRGGGLGDGGGGGAFLTDIEAVVCIAAISVALKDLENVARRPK